VGRRPRSRPATAPTAAAPPIRERPHARARAGAALRRLGRGPPAVPVFACLCARAGGGALAAPRSWWQREGGHHPHRLKCGHLRRAACTAGLRRRGRAGGGSGRRRRRSRGPHHQRFRQHRADDELQRGHGAPLTRRRGNAYNAQRRARRGRHARWWLLPGHRRADGRRRPEPGEG